MQSCDPLFDQNLGSYLQRQSWRAAHFPKHVMFRSFDDSPFQLIDVLDVQNCGRSRIPVSPGTRYYNPNMLEFWAHNEDPGCLKHALNENVEYHAYSQMVVDEFMMKGPVERLTFSSDPIFEKFMDRFFGSGSLPESYKWPTMHFKCLTLPLPCQLGFRGQTSRLCTETDPSVHLKFAKAGLKEISISKEEILNNYLEVGVRAELSKAIRILVNGL